jgi:NAD(P)-dependent dehydrogenase (short-subunit alcohol dehydrogenase family)
MTPRNIKNLFDLTGKTALITGGSRGLGLQIAHSLGEAGATVMLSARKQDELDAAVAELTGAGIKSYAFAADSGNADGALTLAGEAMRVLGNVDILVNNAGASWGAAAEDHPIEAWDKVMNLNVRGIFLLTQAIGRASMIPRRTGSVINVASIAGLGGNPPFMKTIAYNTSKGAVINFTKTLAAEWGQYGIRINAIAPGFFPSKMTKGLLTQAGGAEALAKHAPLQRIGDDEDLKGVALLFASDAGKHITGQTLAVDGGVSVVTGG